MTPTLKTPSTVKRITINLAPADLKKEGSGFDLPMAIGILGAYGSLHLRDLSNFLLVGELGLDGSLRPVQGMLPIAIAARERGIRNLLIPAANAREAAVVEGIDVFAVRSLPQAVDLVNAPESFSPVHCNAREILGEAAQYSVDLRDVRGQMAAKRALEIPESTFFTCTSLERSVSGAISTRRR